MSESGGGLPSSTGAGFFGAGAALGNLQPPVENFNIQPVGSMPHTGVPSRATVAASSAEFRERSAYTAAGRLRQEPRSVEQLLIEQNQMLFGQLQLLQKQMLQTQQSQGQDSRLFQMPEKVLNGVDPSLKQIFDSFATDVKHLFAAWETQKALNEKYAGFEAQGELHPHFQAEASYKWQFTKLYMANAKAVAAEEDMPDESYDVMVAWENLRKKHAEECFRFVCQHQAQCVSLYEQQVSLPALQQKLHDRLDVWFADNDYDDEALQGAMKAKAVQFVDSLVRQERPKIQTRMAKDKDRQQKREQALTEAQAKWESMDVKDVLSPALFDLAKARAGRNQPIRVKDDSALAFLVKDNEELCRKHNVKIEASQASGSNRHRTPTPKGHAGAGAGKGQKGKNRPDARPPSILRASSPASSKASSKGRGKGKGKGRSKSSSKKVRFAEKGQGKGKAKGKRKGK